MLNNFIITLLLSIVFFTETCFSYDTASTRETSWNRPRTVQQITESYSIGVEAGATHMLVIWDRWDYDTAYDFILYVFPGENVNDLYTYYQAPGYYWPRAVFTMHLDITQQLQQLYDGVSWHPDILNNLEREKDESNSL